MLQPFPLDAVRLLDGPVKDRQRLTARYLLDLDLDRLLHNFRACAGLPSEARPLGGGESPGCGLRGHFVGHYLSACALLFAATGEAAFRRRAGDVVAELERCQQALAAGGYVSAFPVTQFDLLEGGAGGAWAPYYTIHKLLAGLLDAHRHAGDAAALRVARRLGDWVARRIGQFSPGQLDVMLRTDGVNPSNEFGGIGAALYDLYELTRDEAHLAAARTFDREWFLAPLIARRDELAGLHANTHVAQVLAAARRYEVTGDDRYRAAVEYFWERVTQLRAYVNGGSSGPRPDRRERSEGAEHWPHAGQFAGTLTPRINESCVVHNLVRLTDKLFAWSGDPHYADYRERALLNSVLAIQHPRSAGSYLYSHPLSGGSRKVYGDADGTFWCCYGTSVEAYARLADGIYFHDGDDAALWVCQFTASEATWPNTGVRIAQQTEFPRDPRTTLTIHARDPRAFELKLRVPAWSKRTRCWVNEVEQPSALPAAGLLTIRRRWGDGDTVRLTFEMSLRAEPLPGAGDVVAFVHGPTVLAARTPHPTELGVPASRVLEAVRPAAAADTLTVELGSGASAPLVPLNSIGDEPFGVYFTATAAAATTAGVEQP
jgi:DUF1680 family protein